MNRKRAIVGLLALLAIALVVATGRSRRRLDDAWDDEIEEERIPVAVPVATTRAPDPVVVSVETSAEAQRPVVVPVAAATAQAGAGGAPFGPGSAVSGPDGTGPAGWVIKAKDESHLYHTPASPSWERMHADAWFESEEAAEAAGFKRWDWRRSRA